MEGDIDLCIEFLNSENIVPIEIHQCLRNVCRDMTFNVNTGLGLDSQ
jgi:hypothetical protein